MAHRKSRNTIAAIGSVLLILGAAAGAAFYGPQFSDVIRAQSFKPSAQVTSVEDRLKLTSRGTAIFYASAPKIEDKTSFNKSCQSSERTTAILGCYWNQQIYLYDIQNEELDGTLEVTAAHEMLHAAYERLNWFERAQINNLLQAEYDAHREDVALKQIMQYYEQSEPGQELNELHSLIGTTVANISPDLEEYYARYFTDRSAIVALNTKYNAVFGEISRQADSLEAKIKAEEPLIQAELAQYDAEKQQLEIDIQAFNARANSGGFSSVSSFNIARQALSSRLNEMNARQNALNERVAAYNKLVEELNQLAVRVDQLNESINGASATTGL